MINKEAMKGEELAAKITANAKAITAKEGLILKFGSKIARIEKKVSELKQDPQIIECKEIKNLANSGNELLEELRAKNKKLMLLHEWESKRNSNEIKKKAEELSALKTRYRQSEQVSTAYVALGEENSFAQVPRADQRKEEHQAKREAESITKVQRGKHKKPDTPKR